ncbi:maleylacetate reductase [Mesorhizobium sp. B2-4-14]|uniref:maleylacetate reductase n=1 Tax=Mesorhizobium sp. B2-4-14 TaxID=2589935 RepID=UPI001129879D|nr:maleylacetate reductase [Mesorhizobium sp. B2-4-14]TPL03616.1 maleylacetate reductase [Mesorhizobium sp. B2-4-14]
MSSFLPEFAFSQVAVRVRFAPGVRHDTGAEVERLGCRRAIIISTPGQVAMAHDLRTDMGEFAAGVLPLAQMHTPVPVTQEAVLQVGQMDGDCLVAIGGGSTVGLAKALSLRTGLPQIVLPTTYAGSEATPVLGQTEDWVKTTLTDARVQPQVILYDAELIRSLPVSTTVASALNAMAHAAEGLYARDRNPISTLLATEGLRAFRRALPDVCRNPRDLTARGETLYAAWLCGTVLGQVGMALHHKLCHVLGGSFGLPHAETHAVMLRYTIAFNATATGALLDPMREIFDDGDVGHALAIFADGVGAPRALRDLGMREADLAGAADLAMSAAYWNPRPLIRDEVLGLLRSAWAGEDRSQGGRG